MPTKEVSIINSLVACGMKLPADCTDVTLSMPLDGIVQISVIAGGIKHTKYAEPEDIIKFGHSLIRFAEESMYARRS